MCGIISWVIPAARYYVPEHVADVADDTQGSVSAALLPAGPLLVITGAASYLWREIREAERQSGSVDLTDAIFRTVSQFEEAPTDAVDCLSDAARSFIHLGLVRPETLRGPQ